MADKKKQHFVPRFYLKHFSLLKNGKTIGIFNIENEKFISEGSLKDQACKNYFYGKDKVIEDALSILEGPSSKIISKIINHERFPNRATENHILLLTFIIFLHSRTKYIADEQNEMTDKFVKLLFSKDPRLKENLDKIHVGLTNAPQTCLKTAAMSLPLVFDLNYKILVNQTRNGLLTSDNPVVLYNQFMENKKAFGSNTGLAVKGLQLFLPLSPQYMIIFFDQSVYRIGNKRDTFIKISNTVDIDSLNILQCVNAYGNIYFDETVSAEYIGKIYSKCKKFRRKVKTVLKEYPGEMEPDGKVRSLLHSYKSDVRIGLRTSFITITKKAKKYNLGNKTIHLRDEALVKIHRKFMDAVNKGYYKPNQFKSFLDDRQKD